MSARVADALLALFVAGYIIPGALLELVDLAAWMTGHGPARLPYPAPPWPVGR